MRPEFDYSASLAQKLIFKQLVQTDFRRFAFADPFWVAPKYSLYERAKLSLVRCIRGFFFVRHTLKPYGSG